MRIDAVILGTMLAALAEPALAQQDVVRECDASGACETRFVPPVVKSLGGEAAAVAVVNRAENADFGSVSGLRAWTPFVRYGAVATTEWSASDVAGSATSGSVHLANTTVGTAGQFTESGLRQCIRPGNIQVGQQFSVQARVFVPAGQSVPIGNMNASAGIMMMFYANPDCTGAGNGQGQGQFINPGGTGGSWSTVASTGPAATGRTSVLVEIVLRKRGDLNPVEAYVDAAVLQGSYGFVKGDLDRDGETDLVLHNTVSGANQAWLMNNEERAAGPVTITPAPASLNWQVAGIDDFNADGQNDLLMWDVLSGAAEFWLMNGTDRVGSPVALAGALAPPWKPSATADFNHDGSPDVVWRNFTTQKISIWTMNGTAQVGALVPSPDQAVDANWEIVAAQDLNADGNVDFLWYNATSGKIVYWWMNASVLRIAGNFTNPANAGANNWKVLAGGDYGIGLSAGGTALAGTNDIVWRNQDSGRLVIWFMDNAGNRTWGTFVVPDPPAPATDWTVAGPR